MTKSRKKTLNERNAPTPMIVDKLLVEVAGFVREDWHRSHPEQYIGKKIVLESLLETFEARSWASKTVAADGTVTWRATPELRRSFPSGTDEEVSV